MMERAVELSKAGSPMSETQFPTRIKLPSRTSRASQVVLVMKNPPANAGDIMRHEFDPGWEDPLEEGMATHISILTWRIPRIEEPGGPNS